MKELNIFQQKFPQELMAIQELDGTSQVMPRKIDTLYVKDWSALSRRSSVVY